MAKRSTPARIDRFKQDYTLLRNDGIAHGDIAKEMGVDEGNLTNYIKGEKKPGAEVLDRFYAVFEGKLYILRGADALSNHVSGSPPNPDSPPDQSIQPEPSSESPVGDGSERSLNPPDDREDHIQTLKLNNRDLHTHLGAMIKNNEILVISNQKLIEAQLSLIARLDQPNK